MRRDLDIFNPWSNQKGISRTGNNRNRDIFSMFTDLLDDNDLRQNNFSPAVDVEEVDDHFVVSADLPGVKEEDLEVRVDGNQLTIRAERQDERKGKGRNRNFSERFYGSFERTFTLPSNVDQEKIECDFENGVLRVAIPKGDESKSRKLEVNKKSGGLLDRLLGKSKTQDDEGGGNIRRASNQ
jgi:HSP20 family protein